MRFLAWRLPSLGVLHSGRGLPSCLTFLIRGEGPTAWCRKGLPGQGKWADALSSNHQPASPSFSPQAHSFRPRPCVYRTQTSSLAPCPYPAWSPPGGLTSWMTALPTTPGPPRFLPCWTCCPHSRPWPVWWLVAAAVVVGVQGLRWGRPQALSRSHWTRTLPQAQEMEAQPAWWAATCSPTSTVRRPLGVAFCPQGLKPRSPLRCQN